MGTFSMRVLSSTRPSERNLTGRGRGRPGGKRVGAERAKLKTLVISPSDAGLFARRPHKTLANAEAFQRDARACAGFALMAPAGPQTSGRKVANLIVRGGRPLRG